MTVAQQKSRIEIRLEPHFASRRPCFFCDRASNKDTFIAAVYDGPEFTGYVVCAECQGASDEVLVEHLSSRAAQVRREADWLNEIAADLRGHLPLIPTPEAMLEAHSRLQGDSLDAR